MLPLVLGAAEADSIGGSGVPLELAEPERAADTGGLRIGGRIDPL